MLGQSLLNCDQLPDTRRGIEQTVKLDAKGVYTFETRARTPDAEVCMSEPNEYSDIQKVPAQSAVLFCG